MSEEVNNGPKTPLEAAIDKATGYKPGDETSQASGETKPKEVKESAAPEKEKRDWVKEAYECFIKNVDDVDPTDPVRAIGNYFEKNATDELKARAKAEGKTVEGCWSFIEAVARKALGGKSGHIDPVVVYAIAMHYFQDVPALEDFEPALKKAASEKRAAAAKESQAVKKAKEAEAKRRKAGVKAAVTRQKKAEADGKAAQKPQEKPEKVRTAGDIRRDEKRQKAKGRVKTKNGGKRQGFFFDLIETPTVGPNGKGVDDAQ